MDVYYDAFGDFNEEEEEMDYDTLLAELDVEEDEILPEDVLQMIRSFRYAEPEMDEHTPNDMPVSDPEVCLVINLPSSGSRHG